MMALSPSTITWGGITFTGSGPGDFTVTALDGWEGLPSIRTSFLDRPTSHGQFDAPAYASSRVVVASGLVSGGDRDALLAQLESAFVPTSGLAELGVSHAGRDLVASARVTRFDIVNVAWGSGVFRWAAEWSCPDPLRYGDMVQTATGFPDLVGGLEYDLFTDSAGTDLGYLDFGDPSSEGRVLVSNAGSADTWPVFQVDGPTPAEGFDVLESSSGRLVRYEGSVPSGSTLVLDAATGRATMDGTADRGSYLTWREWSPIPAGGSAEFAFIPLGARTDASLRVQFRPAFW